MTIAIYRVVDVKLFEEYGEEGLANIIKLAKLLEPNSGIYKAWIFHDVECNRLEKVALDAGFDSIRMTSKSGFDTPGRVWNYFAVQGLKQANVSVILPASCIFRQDALQLLKMTIDSRTEAYYGIGVWHGTNIDEYLGIAPPALHAEYEMGKAKIVGITRPWLVFTVFSDILFPKDNPDHWETRRELLWKVGFPGVWDREDPEKLEAALQKRSKYYSNLGTASWVWQPSSDLANDLAPVIEGLFKDV